MIRIGFIMHVMWLLVLVGLFVDVESHRLRVFLVLLLLSDGQVLDCFVFVSAG